jgi:2-succinyl-6-hydroxy-2,4-cyclohexadiene-1-carboxylate synthase
MRCALLHGFAGDPAVWDDAIAAWLLPEPPFALALPGHGEPLAATWDDNLARLATRVARCDVVVGYSLGARLALGLLATARAPRVVLIGVNPGISGDERVQRRAVDAEWAKLVRTQGIAAFLEAWERQPLFATQLRVPASRLDARRRRREQLDAEDLARSLEIMGLSAMPDYRDAMTANRARIALLAGGDDTKYATLGRTLPAAWFETIPDCGHDPTLESPALLAAAIARAVRALR